MKKTIMALMALAGVASAASVGYNSMTEAQKEGVALAWDFSNGEVGLAAGSVDMGSDKWPSDNFSLTANNTATVGTSGTSPWSSRVTGMGTSFTLNIDVISINADTSYWPGDGNYQAIYSLYSNGADTYCFNCITLGFNREGKILLTTKGENDSGFGGGGDHTIDTGLYVSDIDNSTFTLVSDSTAETLTLYIDGVKTGEVTDWKASGDKSMNLTGFQFGSSFSEKNTAKGIEVSNITVWNAALNSSSVGALIVPEPTTATLSLLALAGLAARRRRK